VNDASGNHTTKTNLKPEITGLFSLPSIGLILFAHVGDWIFDGISRKHGQMYHNIYQLVKMLIQLCKKLLRFD